MEEDEVKNLQLINAGQEDEMEIYGYRSDSFRKGLTTVFTVLTLGFLRLVFYWKPEWHLKCTHVLCPLDEAKRVLLKDQYEQWFVERIKSQTSETNSQGKDSSKLYSAPVNADCIDLEHGKVYRNDEEVENLLCCPDRIFQYFNNKKIKYLWNQTSQSFEKLKGTEENLSCSYFHETKGLTEEEQAEKRAIYGDNSIIVRVTPIIKLLFTQALNPFYVFQLFSVILWYCDQYEYYATCILIISIVSLTVQVYETRKMQRALKSTVTASEIVSVYRRELDAFVDIPSDLLVPGDVTEVPRYGCIMQCDAVLINGNCIVNESMLTGESVPVTKTPIPSPQMRPQGPDQQFNLKEHSRHVLFCGTKVIQTRYYGDKKVRAVVIRTGFSTAKGELVRSIMFPKPVDFKFSQDSFKFIGVLALIASIGMVYTLVIMISRGDDWGLIILRTLDLITIVIPPALPAAMTIGIVFAQNRLKKEQVYCISPRSINLCGALNTFCFDKTGTLTEDGLDLWGMVPVLGESFAEVEHEPKRLGREPIIIAMATCHSLTIIDGEIAGDPLDLKMFDSTGWDLEEPGEDTSRYDTFMPTVVRPKKPDLVTESENMNSADNVPFEVGILRQFTFSSRLQRMSVIARTLGNKSCDLYAKGAPEMIASLCKQSTVPANFHEVLMQYTQQGYRVLALAWKPLSKLNYVKLQRAQREQMERELHFLGLLVMDNRLKPETTPIIDQLKDANIRTIMITGDNMLTALSVARDCNMIEKCDRAVLVHVIPPLDEQPAHIQWMYAEDSNQTVKEVTTHDNQVSLQLTRNDRVHFAMTGKSWALLREYFPELVPKIIIWGTVFARMSPEQKQQLVEALQDVEYYVGMCGDGANDCGALKTAHAGISLSDAEASVASPFTSKEPNISCVPNVIREGRAALVTSLGVFKYMACYSLTQFTSVCLLYWIGANLTDFTFLYIDLFLLTTLGITFCYTGAYHYLVPKTPTVSLISMTPILSIIVQMVVMMSVQIIVWFYTQQQPWFEAFVPNDDEDYACHEVTVIFCISAYQYITLSIVFSKGTPYRKTIFTNYVFLVNIILIFLFTVYVCIYPWEGLEDLMELVLPPSYPFRLLIIGIAAINFFVCFSLEEFVVDGRYVVALESYLKHLLSKDATKHQVLEQEMMEQREWPPVCHSSWSMADLLRMESNVTTPDVDNPDTDFDLISNFEEDTASQVTAQSEGFTCATEQAITKLPNEGEIEASLNKVKSDFALRRKHKSSESRETTPMIHSQESPASPTHQVTENDVFNLPHFSETTIL